MASNHIVEVCAIKNVISHKQADSLEIVIIKEWECIVKKGKYKKGEKIIFIPPDSILPTELADQLGVRNYLAGPNKDRVKCARLRGVMSFGLVMDMPEGEYWKVGTDVKEHFGITKYDPPIRTAAGDAESEDLFFDKFTDIQNLRHYPEVFKEGEKVVVPEKIDGTQSRTNVSLKNTFLSKLFPLLFSSKIIWKAGSHNVKRKQPPKDKLAGNIYWYPFTLPSVQNLMNFLIKTKRFRFKNITLYGEIYGRITGGLKLMNYGIPNELGYVAFGLKIDGEYISWNIFKEYCNMFEVEIVPVIGEIPFNMARIKEMSEGDSLLAKRHGAQHMREGVVVLPIRERNDPDIGRAILKLHSDTYLDKKNKREAKGEVVDYTDN